MAPLMPGPRVACSCPYWTLRICSRSSTRLDFRGYCFRIPAVLVVPRGFADGSCDTLTSANTGRTTPIIPRRTISGRGAGPPPGLLP